MKDFNTKAQRHTEGCAGVGGGASLQRAERHGPQHRPPVDGLPLGTVLWALQQSGVASRLGKSSRGGLHKQRAFSLVTAHARMAQSLAA